MGSTIFLPAQENIFCALWHAPGSIDTNPFITSTVVSLDSCCDGRTCVMEATVCMTVIQRTQGSKDWRGSLIMYQHALIAAKPTNTTDA